MADQIKFEGNKVTITLENPLNGETNYHVKVDATAIVDKAGNAFQGVADETTMSFTTAAQ